MAKMQEYDRHSTVDMSTVIEMIRAVMHSPNFRSTTKIKGEVNGTPVKLSSLRLQTFAAHGTTCAECGQEASFFAVERDLAQAARNGSFHINLYGIDSEGKDVLFTHDHVVARALGGKDRLENTRTCCYHCNNKKAGLEGEISQHLKLGATFDWPDHATTTGLFISDLLEIYQQLGPVPGSGYKLEDVFPELNQPLTFFTSLR